jgi:hypothetical protein
MLYINQYEWDSKVYHWLAVAGAMKEYINRSGKYIGPDDPYAPDDMDNPNYFLPIVSEEVKAELSEGMRILRMAYVYESRFKKLREAEDDEQDFIRLLKSQLEEVGFHLCINCGVRDTTDRNGDCRYCGEKI